MTYFLTGDILFMVVGFLFLLGCLVYVRFNRNRLIKEIESLDEEDDIIDHLIEP